MERNGFKQKGASTVGIHPANSAWKLEKSRHWLVNLLMIGAPILLCFILVLIYMFASTIPPRPPYTSLCLPSAESNSSYLTEFLERFQRVYFHHLHPQSIYKMQGVTSEDIRLIFRPYDPRPNVTKNRTDEAAKLLDELNDLKINTSFLKLRERKAVHVTKALLRNNFGWAPYAQNYYVGDWLLGPDMFCWQPICSVFSDLNGALLHFKPHNIADLKRLRELFDRHNHTFEQYIDNLKLGALTGYVRPRQACEAGLYSLKYVYYTNVADGNESGIYEEDFSKLLLSSGFFEHLSESDNQTWAKDNVLNVTDYFNQSLFENIARPAIKMLRYVETEHLENCPDSERIINGLGRLPLAFLYYGAIPDTSKAAIQRLPTGEMLNGSTTYATLMSFFTSLDITPQQLRQRAVQRLNEMYKQAVEIAVLYTEETNNRTAVNKFITVLQDPNTAFNVEPFPANESGDEAFAKCRDNKSAQAYCPKRWSAMNDWVNHSTETMEIIRPYLSSLFHENGAKNTVPVCPVAVVPWFNPYSSFHSYTPGDKDCNVTATQGLPFFLERYGPRWTEYTTTAHEQLPGHHLEVQSFIEYFEDSCTDPIHWLSSINFFAAMTEGWTTYVEYQLLPENTELYTSTTSNKEILLQRYGMVYYQLLAALRAIVDIDLNFYDKTRENALEMYDDYVWERGDLAQKDITRTQSAPGFVTSYMIGQMEISRLRAMAEEKLGRDFSLKDFHYQILRQGELPLAYLEEHIEAYIKCRKEPIFEECQEIL